MFEWADEVHDSVDDFLRSRGVPDPDGSIQASRAIRRELGLDGPSLTDRQLGALGITRGRPLAPEVRDRRGQRWVHGPTGYVKASGKPSWWSRWHDAVLAVGLFVGLLLAVNAVAR
jgi:hypothetical protein